MAAAKLKEGDKVKLAGTKQVGKISSIDGDVATVAWDNKSSVGTRVDVSALAKK